MSAEHVHFLKPDPIVCAIDGCGIESCTAVGQPTKNGHPRGCSNDCRSCRGRRNRAKGDTKARKARKALGIPGANTRHEELLGGSVRWEAKAGAQVRPMWSAFLRAERQSEDARAFGDSRPFVMTAAADGQSDQLVAFRLSRLDDVLVGLSEQRGLIA